MAACHSFRPNSEPWLIQYIKVVRPKWLGIFQSVSTTKECRSIVRGESSVYFNVTAKHVWHLVATVYKPTVPCMITIGLSDIWLISEAIYHLIFTQDPLNWSLESPPQHRDDFVMPTFLYRVKKQPKMLTLVKMYMCHIMWQNWNYIEHSLSGCDCW